MESSYNSLFIGKSFVHYEKIDSTNVYLSELLSNSSPPEGFVVSADYQTKGSGQVGKTWESLPAQNVLMSVYLTPSFLSIDQVFYLNIIVSLALRNVLLKYIPEEDIKIKWPNDLFIKNKKVAGILIKNNINKRVVQKSIIGIGLNVFQSSFDSPQATSIQLASKQELDLINIKEHILYSLEQYYLILKSRNYKQLLEIYEASMYQKDTLSFYHDLKTDLPFSGKITGVTKTGKLSILAEGVQKEYDLHQIKYL